MNILQVTSPASYEIQDVPTPTPGPGQVLTRVEAVTTCPQWDLHLRHNEPMFVGHRFEYPYTPGQPGHEACGFIEQVGEGVTSLAPGDRVCAWRDAGHHLPGCYAQFVVHEADHMIRVPDGPPPEALASLELAMCVGTVFRMLRDMNMVSGRRFGVTGLGPAGLVAAQMAKAEGAAEVIGFDMIPDRRELALTIGADACLDPTADVDQDFPALQTSVDCVGAKASVEFLMDRTSDAVALFGVQREMYAFEPRHYTLKFLGYGGHSRESAEYAVSLIEAGKLDLGPLVTHVLPLERYGEGIDLLESRDAVKICYKPWE